MHILALGFVPRIVGQFGESSIVEQLQGVCCNFGSCKNAGTVTKYGIAWQCVCGAEILGKGYRAIVDIKLGMFG